MKHAELIARLEAADKRIEELERHLALIINDAHSFTEDSGLVCTHLIHDAKNFLGE